MADQAGVQLDVTGGDQEMDMDDTDDMDDPEADAGAEAGEEELLSPEAI